jgi:hypothetical protein
MRGADRHWPLRPCNNDVVWNGVARSEMRGEGGLLAADDGD